MKVDSKEISSCSSAPVGDEGLAGRVPRRVKGVDTTWVESEGFSEAATISVANGHLRQFWS